MLAMTEQMAREIAHDPISFRQVAAERVAFLRKLADWASRQEQGFHGEEIRWRGEADALEAAVRGLGGGEAGS